MEAICSSETWALTGFNGVIFQEIKLPITSNLMYRIIYEI
jgi:hypothetical protein